MYEVIEVEQRDGKLTLIKTDQMRVVVFSYDPISKWETGIPAIVIPLEGEFLKAQVVRREEKMAFESWPAEEPWPLPEDLADHTEILMVALTCFPSDKGLAPDADASQAPT